LALPRDASVKEVYAGTVLERNGDKISLEVPPSGIRVLELVNAPFQTKQASGLLGLWEFNGDVKDSSGNNRNAKAWDVNFIKSGPHSVLDFRQATGRPLVNVDFNLKYPLIAGTFEVWAAPDLKAEWDATAPVPGAGYLICSPQGLLKLYAANGRWGFVFGEERRGPACIDGEWTHLAVTWGDFEARFYVNGKEVSSPAGPIKFSTPAFPYSRNSPNFNIGAYGRGQHRRQFKGLIGEVRLYNRQLTSEEITASYRDGLAIYKTRKD